MFADDTKLIAAIRPNLETHDKTKFQEDINRVTEWFKRWYVSLNTAKCKIMNIGRLNQGGD